MLVSLLVHLILAVLIWTDMIFDHEKPKPPDEPQAIEVQLAPEPKKAPPPPAPKAEEPKPEPAKPQEQSPADVPMPLPKPTPPVTAPPKPPPKPVLEEGNLGSESKAAKHNWLDDMEAAQQTKEARTTALFGQATEPMSWAQGEKHSGGNGPATQNERDFLLSQVVRQWRNRPVFNWQPDAVVHLRVRVLPDGYLASPFNSKERYAPNQAIIDYDNMARNDPRRMVLESLFVALRVAQPLTLPSELRAKAPFDTVLDFKLVDVP